MPIVQVSQVSKSYGPLKVLNEVSFDVHAGNVVVLIGRSGSGKSTMLRCLNGLEKINSGKITVAGHKVSDGSANLRQLRQEVGIVFQNYNLFPHLTVERNITLALTVVKKMAPEDANVVAETVLRRVGLVEKLKCFPEQLSGGQQQRVAIARSLAMAPKVMLFDEVTSALDPELKQEVLKTMEQLAQSGMTMVLVTHEMNFARHVADEIIFMHAGVIQEKGTPDEVFLDPKTQELRQFVSTNIC